MGSFSLYESDLVAMQQVFFPDAEQVVVYDPESECRRNFSSGFTFIGRPEANPGNCSLLICLGKLRLHKCNPLSVISLYPMLSSFPYRNKYFYINNTYGTMRWVWQAGLRKPVFFEMHGGEGQYAMLFVWFMRLALRLGKPGWIANGTWHIYSQQPILQQHAQLKYDQLAFFSGRMMLNKKITLQFSSNNIPAWYAHLLLSKKAHELKEREYGILTELNKQQWQCLDIPQIKNSGSITYLSNVFSKGKTVTALRQQHINAVQEYTDRFLKTETAGDYLQRKDIFNRLANIYTSVHFPAGLSPLRLEELFHALRKLQASVPAGASIEVSLAHMDFSHWNCRIDGQMLAVIDWEKADWETLRWYDLLYFTFQEAEREEHCDLKPLLEQMGYIQKNISIQPDEWKIYLSLFSLEYLASKLTHMVRQHILPYTFNQQLFLWQLWLETLL